MDQGIWRSIDGGKAGPQIDETGIANCGDPGENGCGVDEGYYNLELAATAGRAGNRSLCGSGESFQVHARKRRQTTCSTLDTNFPTNGST